MKIKGTVGWVVKVEMLGRIAFVPHAGGLSMMEEENRVWVAHDDLA